MNRTPNGSLETLRPTITTTMVEEVTIDFDSSNEAWNHFDLDLSAQLADLEKRFPDRRPAAQSSR
ncbi:hypothetical protein Psta_2766 [Pirellula staleyi DSM 6068]|uniref:Uncharacterized protein n=1 Tax=Pirellula staleyi (strain ATCC 27377 / DSM 6068 / ICPB 4128) TaxID=530564 RepID=D2R7K6_PIRSD|nr:hypothetical protein [Pirellula staleyi]ADB17432.1 hypothetical protein Psta_2766 [Pirellula staleyi DSM 6068]